MRTVIVTAGLNGVNISFGMEFLKGKQVRFSIEECTLPDGTEV